MNKHWDYDVPSVEVWREVLRVLKPGGHLLSFGGTRTYHRMVVAIEDAGFEIRDQIQWLYGSGFPKSHNLKDEWSGWGTALKPANEPIVLARKPLSEKTVENNVKLWGTGALNINDCRVGQGEMIPGGGKSKRGGQYLYGNGECVENAKSHTRGRWPANVILDEEAGAMLDEQSGITKDGVAVKTNSCGKNIFSNQKKPVSKNHSYNGIGGASRFFYCAKASKSERNAGLDSSYLIWESEAWLKPDLNLLTENINQLSRGILEDILTDDKPWSTDLYGHSISEQYPKGMIFTIETALKLITELKTLSASQNSSTKDIIQDAIRTIETNGLNLVESVAFINLLSLNTTSEKTEYLLGVVRAALPILLKIKGYAKIGNFHNTVKPVKLMQYLVRLVTPPQGTVLDPYCGSGTTGIAAKLEGMKFIGIEREPEYAKIAEKRLEHTHANKG